MSRRQLAATGVSGDVVDHAVKRGRLVVVHRGVYLVGGAVLTTQAREAGAVLACGAGAAFSHRSAAYRLVLLQSVGRFEVDVLWREARVIVEADSFRWHGDRGAFERDRARDAELTAEGSGTSGHVAPAHQRAAHPGRPAGHDPRGGLADPSA